MKELVQQQKLRQETISRLQAPTANKALIYHEFLQQKENIDDADGTLQKLDLEISQLYSIQDYYQAQQEANNSVIHARKNLIEQLKNQQTVDKHELIYAYKSGKEPYFSPLLTIKDYQQQSFLDTDQELAKLIQPFSEINVQLLKAKATPALTAMKLKAEEFKARFEIAKKQLVDKGDSQSSRVYNELQKASEAATLLYEGLHKLHQQFINLEIDLATFKTQSKTLVAHTKWRNIEPAEKILAAHRRTATGGRTFKQMAHDYLSSFGTLGEWLANSLFGKSKAHSTLHKVTEAIAKLTDHTQKP